MLRPRIDKNKCIYCCYCYMICEHISDIPPDHFVMVDMKNCTGCGACVDICPVEAITMEEVL